ncbi:MAG: aminotransferase class IV [Chloroflexota bacterium]
MDEMVYLNGSIVPRQQAKISISDYGFLYGYGLFETMRAYGGRVFRLEWHLGRLALSAEFLGISVDRTELEVVVNNTIQANNLRDARIRITVSIGEGGLTPDPASCSRPTVLIVAGEYKPFPEQVYQRGFRAVVSSIRRNSQSPLSRLKSVNYLESMLARQEARRMGVDEAICLNERGLLAEASMSNIFLVVDDTLKTPALESGILPGVTREAVLELARESGIKILEDEIAAEELWSAREAFLTSSLIEVMPLIEVDGRPVGDGKPGDVTRRLMDEYRRLVEKELSGQ